MKKISLLLFAFALLTSVLSIPAFAEVNDKVMTADNNRGNDYRTNMDNGNNNMGRYGTDNMNMNSNNYRATAAGDNDLDWGWLGLLGLAGLFGLRSRDRERT